LLVSQTAIRLSSPDTPATFFLQGEAPNFLAQLALACFVDLREQIILVLVEKWVGNLLD
jgi:hypothetical protein